MQNTKIQTWQNRSDVIKLLWNEVLMLLLVFISFISRFLMIWKLCWRKDDLCSEGWGHQRAPVNSQSQSSQLSLPIIGTRFASFSSCKETCTCTYHQSLKDPNCKIKAHLKCLFLFIFLFLVCEDWRVSLMLTNYGAICFNLHTFIKSVIGISQS